MVTAHRWLPAAAFLALSLAPAGLGDSSPPSLTHGAPFLGQSLRIALEGAAPFAPVSLMLSSEGGHSQTPFGTLELRRDRIRHIAGGTTDAAGTWTIDLPIPLDARLAEQEAHFQALVADASAPAGALLSEAFALRLLGPRVYASWRDMTTNPPTVGLSILDAAHAGVVAAVPFGGVAEPPGSNEEGRPVFDATNAIGAIMASRRELVFFDAYFGRVLSSATFGGDCSRILFTDAGRERLYVLETGRTAPPVAPGRLHVFDFATRRDSVTLTLPHPTDRRWCVNRGAREAFFGEYDPSGATLLRRVNTATGTDLGAVAIASAGTFDQIVHAAGQVFVIEHHFVGPDALSTLARVHVGASGMVAERRSSTDLLFARLAAVPDVDRLVVWNRWWSLPSANLTEEPLQSSGAVQPIPLPSFSLVAGDMQADGAALWILDPDGDEFPDFDEPGRVYRLDPTTHAWWTYPRVWTFDGPQDLEILRDELVDLLLVSNRHVPPPIDVPGEVLFYDLSTGVEAHVTLHATAEVLTAVPIP